MDYSSGAGGREKVEAATSLPEQKLNLAILCKAFVSKVMNGLGTLATIWATVVLLGGFSVLIKQQDFWYVTIVAFVESIGILGGSEDPTYQIFVRAPVLLIKGKKDAEKEHRLSWWRRRIHHDDQQSGGTRRNMRRIRNPDEEQKMCERSLGMTMLVALRLTEIAAVATCIVLSSRRLKKQDYVDPKDRYAEDHRNIRWSLNIFYGLVLTQSIIFIILRLNLEWVYVIRTKYTYRLFWSSGKEIIHRYRSDNYLEFITGNVRATLNMNLITFAKNLVVSDSTVDDQLVGIRAMDRILRSVEYNSLALTRLRASLDADALGKLIGALGLFGTADEKDMRGHAARVVLKLAPDILVDTFPQALSLISSSLLETASNMDMDLVWFGLRILDKLTDNQQNCRQAKELGDLLPKIIDLTNLNHRGHGRGRGRGRGHGHGSSISDSWIEQEIIPLLEREEDIPLTAIEKIDQQIIVGMSFKLLSKLVATPGDVGNKLRAKASENMNLLTDSGAILEHEGAVKVIGCLALDAKTKEVEIGTSPEIIRKLKGCLLSKAPHVDTTKMAANLSLLEYTSSEQLTKIKLSIDEKNILLEDPIFSVLTTTAFIEALDLDQILPSSWKLTTVQDLDLDDLLSAEQVHHCEAAAKALVVLTSGCQENVSTMVQEITVQEMKTMVRMIFPEREDQEERRRIQTRLQECNLRQETLRVVKKIICAEGGGHTRSLLAKLLQNLRAHGHGNATDHMQAIDGALPKVLKAVVDEVAKLEHPSFGSENLARDDGPWVEAGKVLDSFIGLTVQICKGLDACGFAETLNGVNLTLDTFVMKLKKILELYKYPTIDFPSIRRSTLELMTWMVQKNSSYREIFLQCGVYEQLKEVAKTAGRVERFELFHCGVGVGGKDGISHIPSLVSGLKVQLELCPHFEQRSHYYGAHAGTLTVLVA